jgi:hypothetical protein
LLFLVSFCSSWVIVADLPGVASISAVPFELVFAGIGFPAVDGVHAVASMPADLGIPILAGGWTLQ